MATEKEKFYAVGNINYSAKKGAQGVIIAIGEELPADMSEELKKSFLSRGLIEGEKEHAAKVAEVEKDIKAKEKAKKR